MAVCNLNRIAYNLGRFLFSQEKASSNGLDITNGELDALQELNEWADKLPECLKESIADLPHVISLQ